MKYVIDASTRFDGAVVTCMTDDVHCDYDGTTIEQMRVCRNNPNLTTIGTEELGKLYKQYISDLHNATPEEISEEEYFDSRDCLPPARSIGDMFFVGEPYYGDVFPFCFKVGGRYFRCRKRINTPISQLREEIAEFMTTQIK